MPLRLSRRSLGIASIGVAAIAGTVLFHGGGGAAASMRHRAPATTVPAPTTAALPTTAPPPPTTLGPVPVVPEKDGWGVNFNPLPGSLILDLKTKPITANDGPWVALTFDDGPSKYTRSYLEILRREKVPATFFMISENAKERPDDAKAVKAAGFHIGAHTKTHPKLSKLSTDQIRDEVDGSITDINAVLGPGTVKCFRPPYGDYNDEVLNIAAARGVGVVNWDIDTNDWKKPGAGLIESRASNVGSASIVLMHDGGGNRAQTLEALPRIIANLKAKNAKFVAIC